MVGGDVVVLREVFVADGAYPALLDNLSVQKLPQLGRRPQLPISSRVMGIFDALYSQPDQPWFGDDFSSATRDRSVNRADFIGTESHSVLLVDWAE